MIDLTVLIKNRSDWTLLLVMINGEIKNLPLSFGHQIEFYKKLMTGLNVTSWFLKFLSYDIDPDWKRKSIQILPFFIFPQNPSHQSEMWISSHWKYLISSLRAQSGDKIGENESIKCKQILLLRGGGHSGSCLRFSPERGWPYICCRRTRLRFCLSSDIVLSAERFMLVEILVATVQHFRVTWLSAAWDVHSGPVAVTNWAGLGSLWLTGRCPLPAACPPLPAPLLTLFFWSSSARDLGPDTQHNILDLGTPVWDKVTIRFNIILISTGAVTLQRGTHTCGLTQTIDNDHTFHSQLIFWSPSNSPRDQWRPARTNQRSDFNQEVTSPVCEIYGVNTTVMGTVMLSTPHPVLCWI